MQAYVQSSALCTRVHNAYTDMLTMLDIGNIHVATITCACRSHRCTEVGARCKMMLSMMHYHCSSLDRESGDLTWRTSLQISTQASAMCNTGTVCMSDHVWHVIASLCSFLSQSAACRWLLPMQNCSGNCLEKPYTKEKCTLSGECICEIPHLMHRATSHACCNG